MSTDKLGLFNSVWPSDAFNLPWGNQTLHSWQETVFHDFASVYFGRGICQSPVVILEFQASISPGSARIHKWIWLLNSASMAHCNDWMCVSDTKRAFERIDPGMLSGKNSLNPLSLNLNLTIDNFGDW